MTPDGPQTAARGPHILAQILDCDPDLAEDLRGDQLESARRQLVVDVVSYPVGPWTVGPDDFDRVANLGLFLLDGLLTREVTVGDYTCAELLGQGDVLQPWLRIGPERSVASEVGWDVVEPIRAAVLGRDFCEAAAPWPEITAAVSRRLMQRTHWLAFHLAVCGLRRIEDRLLIVLWHFADRWGTVTSEGVRLDVRLTHEVLASVIGARRPSVTSALNRMIAAGRIQSCHRSRWLLLGKPPAELQHVHRTVTERTVRDQGRHR
jgi:CRP/FNR family transcriptional regulator, cyclic AMP receptor protein